MEGFLNGLAESMAGNQAPMPFALLGIAIFLLGYSVGGWYYRTEVRVLKALGGVLEQRSKGHLTGPRANYRAQHPMTLANPLIGAYSCKQHCFTVSVCAHAERRHVRSQPILCRRFERAALAIRRQANSGAMDGGWAGRRRKLCGVVRLTRCKPR